MTHHIVKDWRGGGKAIAIASLLFSLFISLLIPQFALAANGDDGNGRVDYDLDDDGLIEINDLADLDDIRNNLDGTSLYSASTGCPADGCNGFELTTDLDFDTNQDGVMDINDDYWNANDEGVGEGWAPIGDNSSAFSGVFEGNGHLINNLYINRPTSDYVGLFGYTNSAEIRQLGLSGSLMSVTGDDFLGALVGRAQNNNIINAVYNTGAVSGDGYVGGLVGLVYQENQISNSYNTGSVAGSSSHVGGLVGGIYYSNQISASYSTGYVHGGPSNVGGLIGYSSGSSTTVNNSYWAVDSSGQVISSRSSETTGYVGLTLATLQCAIEANSDVNNSECISADGGDEGLSIALTLYEDWGASGYWDFGKNEQLPGLILTGVVHRDSDGDGSLDGDDSWPNLWFASIDEDSDGYPDGWTTGCGDVCIEASGTKLDQFPSSAAGWKNSDLDELLDAWVDGCDSTCQSNSGLTLDAYLDDTDNDGITNDNDSDDNGDGITDRDPNSNGLIDISTLAQLDAIRYQLDGTGSRVSSDAELDQSGCPIVIYQGVEQPRCFGYELLSNLDFDTNQDGVMDANDDYWNAGEGWSPIGMISSSSSSLFTGTFEGNGYVINNLYINRPNTKFIGLFGMTFGAQIRQLGLTGPLMSVKGEDYVGALVGSVNSNTTIKAVYSTGSVAGLSKYVGGLVGHVNGSNSTISASYNTGSVTGLSLYIGGLVGYLPSNNQISSSYSTGYVESEESWDGGLIGNSSPSGTIVNSYWATDSSGQAADSYGSASNSYAGLILANLQCAVEANTEASNSDCVSADGSDEGLRAALTLYKDWEISGYWDFGDNQQLPGLILNGAVYRDSDADGSLDDNDSFPNQPAASLDQDNDGYPDSWTITCDDTCIASSGLILDQFPTSAAAWQDTDFDGIADAWADSCDAACQNTSGLVLDVYPNDTDNDGISNANDTDDNNDGITDIDVDSDGLIDVSTLVQLDAIRNQLDGAGYRATSDAELDQSGCPLILYQGSEQQRCSGYELMNNLDFDTNQDGVMNGNDDYGNSGNGWLPIGNSSNPFAGIFDGNGHVINNLYIYRHTTSYVGLFGNIDDAQIRQLGLTGPLMSVTGKVYVGALAGYVQGNSTISAIYNTGAVKGTSFAVGGLVGLLYSNNEINASYNTGPVRGSSSVGGIVGSVSSNNQITASYSTGYVSAANYNAGGLIGSSTSNSGTIIINSYWATDSSGQTSSYGSLESSGYVGLALASLQCAIVANTDASNSDCISADGSDEGLSAAITLYANWETSGLWSFGNSQQLPSLNLNSVVHPDSDGDGVLNENDAFPNQWAASVDQDDDGYPDSLVAWCDASCIEALDLTFDQFPDSAAAGPDTDLDGLVDEWAQGCDSTCQNTSGFILDAYLDDTDNDGLSNVNDNDDNNDGIIDSDADSNGLIEVSTLAQLDAIRYQLDGSGFRAASDGELDQAGCPLIFYEGIYQQRCAGYELMNDLDFDSNQDGVIDTNDDYWNETEGWMPIGDEATPFTGIFAGNGHVINNLTIKRPGADYIGLFGSITGAQIHQLGLSGSLMSVTGKAYVGALVGYANNSNVINAIYNTGSVAGSSSVGGLIGAVSYSNQISNGYNTASVTGTSSRVGGLVGNIGYRNQISNSYSSGYASGMINVGGLIGFSSSSSNLVTNSYWAIDSSGQVNSSDSLESTGYVGLTLTTLQCAIQANTDASNSTCVSADGSDEGLSAGLALYAGWETSGYWFFGDNQQLPSLTLNSVMHPDSDGDGVLNDDDAFPSQWAASVDQDQDGYPDSLADGCGVSCLEASGFILDQFPGSAAAGLDTDLDGLVDDWAEDCDSVCQSASGLTLDDYLNDTDNDGLTNANDSDDNNDGITDVDADSNGLIEVSTLAQLDAIRNQLDGAGYRATSDAELDQSGCPLILYQGSEQQRCSGYELMSDLDFDTNQDGVMDITDDYWNANDEGFGQGWSPLGSSPTPFTGIFDGNGHVINNLYINRPSTDYIGLFGSISGAEIRQLGLSGPLMSVTGERYVGALVGEANYNNTISASYNMGLVTGLSRSVGGLVGFAYNKNLINTSYNTGSVTGSSEVGGLVGSVESSNQISGSFNTGFVTGAGNVVGGLVGFLYEGNQISASYSTGSVTGSSSVGGVIGYVESSNQITASFSSGYLSAESDSVGGLIGSFEDVNSVITNSYWATDSSGQATSYDSSEGSGYVGLTLATLQCAIEANTAASNSACVSEDGSEEGLNAGLTLYKGWQDSGYWDFGANQQLPGLILNGTVHRDSDGDGSLDEYDAFYLNPAASIDGDEDGQPDVWTEGCDAQCQQESGLEIDPSVNDTDNDLVINSEDADDDNDGVPDIEDAYPLIAIGGLIDTDNDGLPNDCDQACFDAGMTPDNDDDNDGVPDSEDLDLGADNGSPLLISIADDESLSVTTENGFNALVIIDDDYMLAFVATDMVDNDLRFEATLNGSVLTKDEDDQILLPAGNLNIIWVAIDDAGNRSNSLTQNVKVYPQVRFTLAESITGEPSDALIEVGLSGESPVYPVTIELEIDALSEIDQNDLSDSFDISAKHQVVIERGDDESEANTQVNFVIPVMDDGVSENDELLVLSLNGVIVAEDEENFYMVHETLNQHSLTVTYQNLAPVVQLQLKQDGAEVGNVKQDGGDVTVTALVTDGNGNDTHTLAWDLNSLGLNVPLGNVLTFSPANLAVGEYSLSVEATDDGINPLSGLAELQLNVTDPRATEPNDDTASSESSGGGGGTLWWMLFVLAGISLQAKRRRNFN